MHLKALEIQGFKSFPDKVTLGFDAGITAIVGPNGSGKSNISDAIRWVLGEQSSRALRGGKMEDVIFGGTENRKSLGFAQVSLLLDNEDGSLPGGEKEIMVTRRYYRSGESEYYINRHLCRLRDVHELFMDTGLGQEGYSLIGQGKIDEILSVKSTQRREIFEEAAGISRFRHRKEEAGRKLERTKENLLRIVDKIEELELQVEPLREQAEKAKRFFACQDALRLLEVSLWMDRLENLRARNKDAKENYEAMARQLDLLRRETEGLYEALEALSQKARDKEEEIEGQRSALARLEEEAATCEKNSSVLEVRMGGNEENLRRMEEEALARKERRETTARQMADKEEALAALAGQMEALGRRGAALEADLENTRRQEESLEAALVALEEETRQEAQNTQRVQGLLAALDASEKGAAERLLSLADSLSELDSALDAGKTQEEALGREIETLEESLNARRREGQALADSLAQAQAREKSAQEQALSLRMEEGAIAARVRVLEEMERHYEGYSKSVKTVMGQKERGSLGGIRGPLGGLVNVPDRLAVAMEIALGAAMQNLVVETEKDGKAVLDYLKKTDGGRVTCLPMNTIRPNRLEERGLAGARGYVGIAAELLTYDKDYEGILRNLLGRVVICESLELAIPMARQFGNRFRIVTLDGQVIAPGGAMTGGSVNQKGGILTRAKELETLLRKQEEAKARRSRGEEALEEAKNQTVKTQKSLESAREALGALEKETLTAKGRQESQHHQKTGLEAQKARLLHEMALLREKTARAAQEERAAQETMKTLEEAAQDQEARRSQTMAQTAALRRQREETQAALSESQKSLAVLDAQERLQGESLEELRQMQKLLWEEEARQEREMGRLREETQALLAQRQGEEARKTALLKERDALRLLLDTLHREKLALEAKRTQLDRDSRSQNEALLSCQKEAAALEQRAQAALQEEAQLLDKLWETYELSHEAAQRLRQPVENRGEMEKKASSLKSEIRALGSVNTGAVEEYQRVSERYEYLQSQRRDVEESEVSLQGIIQGLTEQMEEIFRREFLKIAKAFSQTFTELFRGGKAALHLEDEGDILNCGIEINVQPPGKTLKSLSLLSGGEKAFVAIALYFAILKVRPTPFCVLDEIEASLDDGNVLRFAHYLRQMSDKTQFVVITHRRGTMEEADILYGVTMERQGVSRMLRLGLKEAEEALRDKTPVAAATV